MMNTQFFVANELAALLAAPVALLASVMVTEKYKGRAIIFGQVAAFLFALFGTAMALTQCSTDAVSLGQLHLPLRFEAVSSCLVSGITFIAAVVVSFSDRYMLGDKTRLSFLRSLSVVSSISALLVVADSLIVAFVCWTSLSFGLWSTMRLWPGSKNASTTVLRYHLVSDVALLCAFAVMIANSGNTMFSDFAAAMPQSSHASDNLSTVASLLLVVAFGIKSALFPCQKWLLATLDAPTPLSALLHAGVVNVSAIMAWRMMPVLHEHPYVLLFWGLWSALSAVIGTLSMSAQPDVKKKLVYSTTGQMGFMSLQCAVGMPGAALFHLIAHGLFKCHMFLQCGSAVSEGLAKKKFAYGDAQGWQSRQRSLVLAGASAVVFGCLVVVSAGWNWTSISTIIAAAALIQTLPALNRIDFGSLAMFWLSALALGLVTAFGINRFEHLLDADYSIHLWLLPVFLTFSTILALTLRALYRSRLAKALYVHSLNGFYVNDLNITAGTGRG